ncbi:MAG: tRNA (adenosine(37)-N6)-threonylcarbamoyltransferase complex transferase subunit TsaD [Candidatus Omnitrophica bacterium]|nr:tRNA (adenosine(37)-N6)-threonylcarbamoyltransferase complex transferase subunit TsaD [Candidatus Omnitrophota bacterium]
MTPSGGPIRILGIETSCDETAIGIVENGRTLLSNVVASSLSQHSPYGGVIPEIAARAHVETIWDVLTQSLEQAHLTPTEIDAVAVTQGPGLPGALVIGLAFAKGLALTLDRPLIPVDHLAAHLYAGHMTDPELEPPYVGLVVSGGHTLLCVAHADCRFEVLGETKDDAVGEAFDKVAKLLGLGYPGGPAIDRLSEQGQAVKNAFPRTQTKGTFDFSFSGLKTAVYQYVEKRTQDSGHKTQVSAPDSVDLQSPVSGLQSRVSGLGSQQIADIAATFQETAVDFLVMKTLRACQRTGITRVVVGGGVASNRRLRARFAEEAGTHKLRVVFPPPALCVDNGAMVAGIAFPLLQRGRVASLSVKSDPNLCLV